MADLNRQATAGDIINRVAVECGLAPVTDPFASEDPAFRQLRTLLTSCGQQLLQEYQWQVLQRTFSLTTSSADTEPYPLPPDFGYMIDQTGWQQGGPAVFPLLGPASPQQWTYLVARDLYSLSIYVWFRLHENELCIFPNDPVPDGVEISFEYISRGWVTGEGDQGPASTKDAVNSAADIVAYEPILIINMLKYKWLAAKGFDTTDAMQSYMRALDSWKGKDNSAPILNMGRSTRGFRLIDEQNVPDSRFGDWD